MFGAKQAKGVGDEAEAAEAKTWPQTPPRSQSARGLAGGPVENRQGLPGAVMVGMEKVDDMEK